MMFLFEGVISSFQLLVFGGLDELQLLDQPPNGCHDKSFVGRILPPYSPQKINMEP